MENGILSVEEILKNRYRQVNDAMVAKDTKTLAELIAPDSVLVHMTGYVQSVKEWLAQIEQDQPLGACKLKWILKRLTVIGKLSNKAQALTRLEREI